MVQIGFLLNDARATAPNKAHATDAGWDLYPLEDLVVKAGRILMVDTGVVVDIPAGHFCDIRTRSGLGSKGIKVSNSPGTIDYDYVGNLKVAIHNTTAADFLLPKDKGIAQLLLMVQPEATEMVLLHADMDNASHPINISILEKSKSRGVNGFGSTDKS